MISAKHAEALNYARDGVPVFPCVVGGKEPACEGGFKAATTDEARINAWWEQADYNLAVCPEDAGWAVIDIDPGGLEHWRDLCRAHSIPPSAQVTTPRGGAHIYFAGSIRASTSKLAPNIDTRGIGSYVLVPPSEISGKIYEWTGNQPTEQLPEAIPLLLAKPAAEISAAAGEPVSLDHLRSLLLHVGAPDMPRNAWRDIVAAIRNCNVPEDDDEGARLELALAWSRGDVTGDPPGNYDSDDGVAETFWSMPPKDGGVGYGTILHAAREGGYAGPSALPIETAQEAFGATLDKLKADTASAPSQDKPSEWEPIHISEFKSKFHEPKWLIPDLLPAEGIVQMIGPRKSFKSFLAMDLSLGLASGTETFGFCPERRHPVVYCVGENANSFALRHVPAWLLAHELEPDFPFFVIPRVPKALYQHEVDSTIESILKRNIRPELFVIDTTTRAMRGLEANSEKEIGIFSQTCDNIRDALHCTVMALRHAGKDLARGSRGSGAFDDDADTNLFVERHQKTPAVKLTVQDQRNAQEREEPYTFEAQAIAGFSLIMKPIPFAAYCQYANQEEQFTRKAVGRALQQLIEPVTTHVLAETLLPGREDQSAEDRAGAVSRAAGTLNRLAQNVLRGYWEGTGPGRLWSLAPSDAGL